MANEWATLAEKLDMADEPVSDSASQDGDRDSRDSRDGTTG